MHYVSNFSFGAQGNRTGSCGQLPDNDEIAVTFCFGEVVAQLQLTYGEVRALDVEAMAGIWKVTYTSCLKYQLLKNTTRQHIFHASCFPTRALSSNHAGQFCHMDCLPVQ
jgi:hypothetical protein